MQPPKRSCGKCGKPHWGKCEASPPPVEDVREAVAKIPAKKPTKKFTDEGPIVPASKRLPHRPGAIVRDDVKAMMQEIDPIKYAPHLTVNATEPATADTPTPPSWWRATETPIDPGIAQRTAEYHARRAAMTIQDKLRQYASDDYACHDLMDEAADRIDALLAEVEELRKYDRRPYFREIQNRSRQKKKAVK